MRVCDPGGRAGEGLGCRGLESSLVATCLAVGRQALRPGRRAPFVVRDEHVALFGDLGDQELAERVRVKVPGLC